MVVFAVDEEDGVGCGCKSSDARSAYFHAALGSEDAFFACLEALVAKFFDFGSEVVAF